jgi:integrase
MKANVNLVVDYLSKEGTPKTPDWTNVNLETSTALLIMLAQRCAPATAAKTLCAYRGILKEALKMGLIDAETYLQASNVSVAPQQRPLGRAMAKGEVRALRSACFLEAKPIGSRDLAIISILYELGLRRCEIAALKLSDYVMKSNELIVRPRTSSRGQSRVVQLPQTCCDALSDWLVVRGAEPGALFCPMKKDQSPQIRHMSEQAVNDVVATRAREAGVPSLTSNDLRRTFIDDMFLSGKTLSAIQDLAGHARVETTLRYDHRRGLQEPLTLRSAAAMVDIPCSEESVQG